MSLDGSIDVESAARDRWDAVVVGAGPAGAVAARELARLGHATLLVERKSFPRNKVCGACVNGRALLALEQLGLAETVGSLAAVPLSRFDVRCGAVRAQIPLPAGVAVSRSAFDLQLARSAIAAGAAFLPETSARMTDDDSIDSGRRLSLIQRGREVASVAANVVLLADGLGNPSLSRGSDLCSRAAAGSRVGIGGIITEVPDAYEFGSIYMAVGSTGYVGLARVEDGRLNVAAAIDAGAVKRSGQPAAAVAALLESARFPGIPSLASAEWSGTLPLTRSTCRPAGRRVLLLGDAAGYVEPFTGEGIACALTSGAAAAALVARSLAAWNEGVEREWVRLHRRLFVDRGRWCRRLAWLLRHPAAVRPLLRVASIAPWLARPIVDHLNESPSRLLRATSPGRMLNYES